METLLATAGLNWTVVRADPRCRVGREGSLPNIGKVSRSDLADFVARQAEDTTFVDRAVAISC